VGVGEVEGSALGTVVVEGWGASMWTGDAG
jgi:hypothetical protein